MLTNPHPTPHNRHAHQIELHVCKVSYRGLESCKFSVAAKINLCALASLHVTVYLRPTPTNVASYPVSTQLFDLFFPRAIEKLGGAWV